MENKKGWSVCGFLSAFHIIFILVAGVTFSFVSYATVAANTLIENTANASFIIEGVPGSTSSNTISFRVDELISFALVSNNASGVNVQSPATTSVLSYTLSNQGNGSESFALSLSQSVVDQFDATNMKIYLDANDNGNFDSGTDTLYSVGVNDPDLTFGTSKNIFVVGDIPSSLAAADEAKVNLIVTSNTGSGVAGTVYSAAGEGGVDAVMGFQSGSLSVENKFVVVTAETTLVKTISVLDEFGGSAAIPNAVITYTLTLNVTGSGTLTNVVVGDVIPAGTTYIANSIRLDSSPLTDAADLDAGVFTGTAIQVSLPTVVAPTTKTVSFEVRIQ